MKSVVVTGVSTGIGLGIAKYLLSRGIAVFGSVRSERDAERLQCEMCPGLKPLVFDVTDEAAIRKAAEKVRRDLGGVRLYGLINNAGIAVAGPLLELPTPELRQQLEINVLGPLSVARAFAPLMRTWPLQMERPGRIINISSIASRLAPPFLGPYAMSKGALDVMSESLRRELMIFGIDVIIVAPGNIATPIWHKAQQLDFAQYFGSPYFRALKRAQKMMVRNGLRGWPPERVGKVVYEALTVQRPKVRYTAVAGRIRNWVIPTLLPHRVLDKLLARSFGILGKPNQGPAPD